MKKFFIYTAIVAAIVVMLLTGGCLWLSSNAQARVAAERAKVKAAGDPLVLADLAQPPIPDEQNAYHFLQLARRDLDAFDTKFAELTFELQHRLRPDEVDALARLVEQYPDLYLLLERAAACPGFRRDVDYASDGFDAILPDINAARNVARAFEAKALVQAYAGNGDDALAQSAHSLQLTSLMKSEPVLVTCLVDIACQAIAELSANHVLRVSDTSPAACQRLSDVLAGINNQQAAIAAMKGERAWGVSMFEQMRAGQTTAGEIAGEDLPWAFTAISWLGNSYLNDDEAQYLVLMDQAIAAGKLPRRQREAVLKPLDDQLRAARLRFVHTRMMAPAMQSAYNASDRAETLNHCLQVLLAAHDKDDATIAALGLPANVTTDAYSGRPLILKRLGDDWVVYSVGENGVDDGGNLDATNGQPLDIGFGPLGEPLAAPAPMVKESPSP
jgi:hypothetical protein